MSSQPARRASAPPVRIHTLGRFAIEAGGEPLATGGKGPGKPLALLKVLIALGGEAVHTTTLSESLWPDAEGDHAYSAFTTTLRRLRTLIGRDALRLESGRLSLDSHLCWVDAVAFAVAGGQARRALSGGDLEAASRHSGTALALYRGPFLAGEFEPVEILAARERLHGQFLRHVGSLSDALVNAGNAERALALCRQGLDVDDVAEELYRREMAICQRLGRASEGLAAYERCRELLQATAGAAPGPEIEALYGALQEAARHTKMSAASTVAGSRTRGAPPGESPLTTAAGVATRRTTLAIKPFAALGDDREQAVFGHGLSEDLGAGLARLVRLRIVRLPPSGLGGDALAQAREAGATHLLEGTVRTAGDRVRVTASLSDVTSRRQLWADRYDRALSDLFAVQDEISEAILIELDVQLLEGEQARRMRHRASSVEAWGHYKLGLSHFGEGRRDGVRRAEQSFRQAMAVDPGYAIAVRAVVTVRCMAMGRNYVARTREAVQELDRLLALAWELEPDEPANLYAQAWLHILKREYELAIPLVRQVAEALSDQAYVMVGCAGCLLWAGEPEEALRTFQRVQWPATERRFFHHLVHAMIRYALHRYADCIAAAKGIAMNGDPYGLYPIGALVAEERLGEAKALADEFRKHDPDGSECRGYLDNSLFRDRSVMERLRGHLRAVGLV